MKVALATALAVLALATPANAAIPFGASGWFWSNPQPQGQPLYTIGFAGATGYAGGDGTLLKTSDGGTIWSALPLSTDDYVDDVQVLDPRTLIVSRGDCALVRSSDGGATFTKLDRGHAVDCKTSRAGIAFVSSSTVYVVQDNGKVLASDDGGVRFARRASVPSIAPARDNELGANGTRATSTAFADPQTGVVSTDDGTLYRTADGGRSWTLVDSGRPPTAEVTFADASTGYAVGAHGLVLRTDDAGRTWTPLDLGDGRRTYIRTRGAAAQRCLLGMDVPTDDPNIDATAFVRMAGDGPAAAVKVPAGSQLSAVAFSSPTRAIAIGENGELDRSDDGGATFSPPAPGPQGSDGAYAAIVAGARAGSAYALGEGGYAVTTDGGRSWSERRVARFGDQLLTVSFPTASTGYALTDTRQLTRTSDGGRHWKDLRVRGTIAPRHPHHPQIDPFRNSGPYDVYAPNAHDLVALGPVGVHRSRDGGRHFAAVRSRAVANLKHGSFALAHGRTLVAWSSSALVRSRDGGRTWRSLRAPIAPARAGKRRPITAAAFSSAAIGFAIVGDRLWRTTDDGRRWRLIRSLGVPVPAFFRRFGLATVTHVALSSLHDVYVTVNTGDSLLLLHSVDGGTTWQTELTADPTIPHVDPGGPDEDAPFAIAAGSGGTDFMAIRHGLLTTRTGGGASARSTLRLATDRRRLAHPGKVVVTGRLRPALAGARVAIVAITDDGHEQDVHVRTAADGSFRSSWKLSRGTTTFVASTLPGVSSIGAGSRGLTVRVKR